MKKILFFMLLICAAGLYIHHKNDAPKKGIIILLNGPSTSGKSTIKQELQKLFPTPFLNLGIDALFVGVLPQRFVTGPKLDHDIEHARVMQGLVSFDENNNRLYTLNIGDVGNDIIHGMHDAIAAYAQNGNNCIVDYIVYDESWIPDLTKSLSKYTIYSIGINAPLNELEQREKDRGYEFVQGHVRSHYETVHKLFKKHDGYDIEIDTQETNASDAAQKIYDFIQKNKSPQSFKRLTGSIKQDYKSSIIQRIKNIYSKVHAYFSR